LITANGAQSATVSTTGSYLSSSDKRVHFGLGPEAAAQSIEISWPSGILQTLKNVRAGQILQIDDPLPPTADKWKSAVCTLRSGSPVFNYRYSCFCSFSRQRMVFSTMLHCDSPQSVLI